MDSTFTTLKKDATSKTIVTASVADAKTPLPATTPTETSAKNFSGDFWALVKDGSLAEIENAIKAGAEVNANGGGGWTPLHSAAKYNQDPEVIIALINAGADLSAKRGDGGPPIHLAAWNNPNPEIISTLIKAGADISAKDIYGGTPLHVAAIQDKNPEVLVALIKAGANVNARDAADWHSLELADLWNDNGEICSVLVKYMREKVSDEESDNDDTPWHFPIGWYCTLRSDIVRVDRSL